MDFTEIGNRIRKIRKSLNLTRDEFADLLDLNQYSVSRLERGERKTLDFELILKISSRTGYSIDEIINGPLSNKRKDLTRRINYLLNTLTDKELEYTFEELHRFSQFMHSDSIRDLKKIKKEIKSNQLIN